MFEPEHQEWFALTRMVDFIQEIYAAIGIIAPDIDSPHRAQ